jgi:hypothetical protein
LDAIALVTAYEEAGAMALSKPSLPAPCPADSRPLCSEAAAGHLSELLSDSRGLLLEWLSLANAGQVRPPEELLPTLLDAATRDRALRPSVAIAAGALGIWLTQFRPGWAWIQTSVVDESAWETGTLVERLAVLRHLRATNSTHARALVESTWQTEQADGKRQFVEALATGLSLHDEAFLESCLDDRSVVVRRAAAELLAALRGSQLSHRMTERIAACIRVGKAGLLRKAILEVTPFDALDAAMIRDGIEKKPPAGSKLGERSWWTMQALACVHPEKWIREFGMPAERLIEIARNGEWSDLLLEGWRTAAIRHRATNWLSAFANDVALPVHTAIPIFRALEPPERERCMLQLLNGEPKSWIPQIPVLCQHPWTAAFTKSMLKAVTNNLPKEATDALSYQLKPCLRASALLASTEITPPPDEAFAEFTDILNYRRKMQHAFPNQENR